MFHFQEKNLRISADPFHFELKAHTTAVKFAVVTIIRAVRDAYGVSLPLATFLTWGTYALVLQWGWPQCISLNVFCNCGLIEPDCTLARSDTIGIRIISWSAFFSVSRSSIRLVGGNLHRCTLSEQG